MRYENPSCTKISLSYGLTNTWNGAGLGHPMWVRDWMQNERIVPYKPITWGCDGIFLYYLSAHFHDISYFIYIRYYVLSFAVSFFLYNYDKSHGLE